MSEHGFLIGLFLIGTIAVLTFSFVLLFGAPFLPTRRARVAEALDLLALKPGQTLLELGSGDGRILRAAAQRKIYTIGYELNPVLVLWTRLCSWRYRQYITLHCANYWQVKLPEVDGVYTFLLQPYMTKIDDKISREAIKPLRFVSFAFPIPDKKPLSQKDGLFLYEYQP